MKIAFCGDSFCANILYYGYPGLVAEEFNAKISCRGIAGMSLYYMYKQVLSLEPVDYIIFCITEPNRLPNKYDLAITASPINHAHLKAEMLGAREKKHVVEAIKSYYEHLFNYEFHKTAQQGILMQLDELMLTRKQKCLWFPCFENSMPDFRPKSGPLADIELFAISCGEYGKYMTWHSAFDDGALQLNHFNEENNKKLADIIINMIKDDNNPRQYLPLEPFAPGSFSLKKHFKTWQHKSSVGIYSNEKSI